jgi:hypothetical protein
MYSSFFVDAKHTVQRLLTFGTMSINIGYNVDLRFCTSTFSTQKHLQIFNKNLKPQRKSAKRFHQTRPLTETPQTNNFQTKNQPSGTRLFSPFAPFLTHMFLVPEPIKNNCPDGDGLSNGGDDVRNVPLTYVQNDAVQSLYRFWTG